MEKYYTIGSISKICNISTKTLRYYDRIKLLEPEQRDEDTGYRYYSKRQLTAILIIRRFRNLGFSIQEIKEAIENPSLDNLKRIIKSKENEYKKKIKVLEAQKSACSVAYERILNGERIYDAQEVCVDGDISNKIKIEHVTEGKLFFSRKIMKQYVNSDLSLSRWIDIYEKCTENGIAMTSSILVTYHTIPLDQFLLKDCDVEFGVLVNPEHISKVDPDNIRDWGGFEACTAFHIGKYEKIMNCHIAMLQWINSNGYEVAGPISEEFIISPLDAYNENEHVTKVIIPIKRS